MIDTPTMTATAVMSAATAMEVRLSERTMSRGAMRPRTPSSRPLSGAPMPEARPRMMTK